MWELDYKESWALKNWWFWTVVLEKTLESPWTARRSNQSILKEISPGCSLEGLMLKLKLQYFGYLMQRADSFEKTLMLGNIEGQEEKGTSEDEMVGWHHWLNGHKFELTPGVSSVHFSHSVISNCLWPHESQHARPPCPSPTPGVHSNSCLSSQWCHPAISSSVVPFSCPQSLPVSESFPMNQLFTWGGQSTGA